MTRKTLSIKVPTDQGVKLDDVVERICENCRFYGTEFGGECHKRSPFHNQTLNKSFFPPVEKHWWCGDYKRLPAKEG